MPSPPSGSGSTAPEVVEEADPGRRRASPRDSTVPGGAGRAGAVDFDEQIYRAIEILLTDPDARAVGPGQMPPPAGRRVPGPQPGPPAAHPAPGRPGLRLLRGRGRRPGHLRLRRRDARVPHQLCPLLPRRRRPRPEGQLPVPTRSHRRGPALALLQPRAGSKRASDARRAAPTRPATFGGPLTGCGPVAVLTAPADALAGLAVETISAWRDGGVDPGDIAVLARVNSALLPVQVACIEAGVPCTTPLSASVLQRTGIRTAFAYLRIGADPDADPARGHPRDDPPPLPGHRPQGGRHAHAAGHHFDHGHPAAGRPPLGPRRPQARGLCQRPRCRGQGCRTLVRCRARGHPGRHRARRHHGRPRLPPAARRTAPPTPTTWPPSNRSPPFTPRSPPSKPGCGRCWPGHGGDGTARCCSPRSIASRAGNGITSSSSMPHGDSSPIGSATTRKVSAGSSTWPSPGPGPRSSLLADADAPSIFLAELDGRRVRASSRPVTSERNANSKAENGHRPSRATGPGRLGLPDRESR